MDLLTIGGPHATKGFGRAALGSAQARAETAWRGIVPQRSCSAYRLRCQFRHAVAECLATTRWAPSRAAFFFTRGQSFRFQRRITMTIRVELNPEMEARLVAEARSQGVPLEKLAERLLKEALIANSVPHGALTVDECHQMLEGMAEGSEKLPNLPTESFSRESFYEDRLDGRDAVPRR